MYLDASAWILSNVFIQYSQVCEFREISRNNLGLHFGFPSRSMCVLPHASDIPLGHSPHRLQITSMPH